MPPFVHRTLAYPPASVGVDKFSMLCAPIISNEPLTARICETMVGRMHMLQEVGLISLANACWYHFSETGAYGAVLSSPGETAVEYINDWTNGVYEVRPVCRHSQTGT